MVSVLVGDRILVQLDEQLPTSTGTGKSASSSGAFRLGSWLQGGVPVWAHWSTKEQRQCTESTATVALVDHVLSASRAAPVNSKGRRKFNQK